MTDTERGTSDVAIVTLASGGDGFLDGVRAIGSATDELMPGYTKAVMLEDGAYPESVHAELRRGGYVVHVVPPIRTKPAEFAAARWPRTFTKLNLWSLPYRKVVYFDADACPFKPFPELFDVEHRLAATHTAKQYLKRFRSGMLVLDPDPVVYAELRDFAENGDPIENGAKLGDQGLLNIYFGTDFHSLPWRYNWCEWKRPKCPAIIGHLRPTPWSRREGKPSMRPYVARWRKWLRRWKKAEGESCGCGG